VQHEERNRLFFTPGYCYRPNELKSMTCLLGNTETRTVYRNFELSNLNVNLSDRTHMLYNRYLCYNNFLPPDEKRYFAHMTTNTLAATPGSTDEEKGAFNIFPMSLTTEEMSKSTSSALGKYNTLFIFYHLYFFLLMVGTCRCGDHIPAQVGDPVSAHTDQPVVFGADLREHLQDRLLWQQNPSGSYL
jgi:hypothetical protein